MRADDVIKVSLVLDLDNGIAKFGAIVPPLFHSRCGAKQLMVIMTQETDRRQHVTTGRGMAVEEKVMHMSGVKSFDFVALQYPQQP